MLGSLEPPGIGEASAADWMLFAKGDIFLVGGGGRGMLGGGGIIRLVGLFTFFILALTLGGGMGVLTDGSSGFFSSSFFGGVDLLTTFGSSFADSADLEAAAAAALASNKAGGTGGGGRRWGLECMSMAVVLRFCCLPGGLVADTPTAAGLGLSDTDSETVSPLFVTGASDGTVSALPAASPPLVIGTVDGEEASFLFKESSFLISTFSAGDSAGVALGICGEG